MNKLPKHIIKSVLNNNTSLGEHPAFPPEDEEKFLLFVLTNYFNKIFKESSTETDIENNISLIVTRCKKIESENADAIEELCNRVITDIFKIPENTIELDMKLSDNVDTSNQRMVPEKTDDFTFDDIDDMKYLTDEIYKRRMLNALIYGASLYYANNISYYVQDLFKINPELPSLYSKIITENNKLLFLKKDTLDVNNNIDAGKVDVYISSEQNKVIIKSEAILLPILLEETIKGILELAISHGLPNNRDKAEYVIKKSDFKLAEVWDMRIGSALWDIIINELDELDINIDDVGINFFFMELSMKSPDEFNKTLQEIFRKTKKGIEILKDICNNILYQKEKDNFDDYIDSKKDDNYTINDGYFTSDELTSDDYFSEEELISDSKEIN